MSVFMVFSSTFAVYADVPSGNDISYWIGMQVAISSLLAAYGMKRTMAGSSDAVEIIEQCASDALQAGYGKLVNGVETIGIGIKNGHTYISTQFANWVLDWTTRHSVYNPPSGGIAYSDFVAGETYEITGGMSFMQLVDELDIPQVVIDEFNQDHGNVNIADPFVIAIGEPYETRYHDVINDYKFVSIPRNSNATFVNDYNVVETQGSYPCTYIWTSNNELNGHINTTVTVAKGGFYQGSDTYRYLMGFSSKNINAGVHVYNGWNAVKVPGADYGLTTDVPALGQSIDDYAPSWAANESTVSIDDVQTNAIPLSIPIDGTTLDIPATVSATDIVIGAEAAITAAGAMSQAAARIGEIAQDIADVTDITTDLTDAIETAETVQTLSGEYTIQGLQDVFPFCLPWDFAEFVSLLNAPPEAPSFRMATLNLNGELVYYTFDFSTFNTVAAIGRTMETLLFIVGLIILTKKLFV